MTREDHISSPERNNNSEYKKFSEKGEDEYKRYAEDIKMFPIDDTPKPFDQYEEIKKKSERIYKTVKPAVKDVQQGIEDYKPKAFGEKRTYPQDWPAYNKAKCNEPNLFLPVLDELLAFVGENTKPKKGRPPYSKRDRILSMCIQAYSKNGSRKAMSPVTNAYKDNYLHRRPPSEAFNSLLHFYSDKSLTPLLRRLIISSAFPLAEVEKYITIDSTGFSISKFERWFNARTGKDSKRRLWKKAHIVSGTKTNVILNVDVTPGTFNDKPLFKPLVEEICKYFKFEEISADMAYPSRKNYLVCQKLGIMPYIPFPNNYTGRPKGVALWRKQYDEYYNNHEEFMRKYHRRSKSESTNKMLKSNFLPYLRTLKETSQINELLVKCLCHNICCIIQESFELGIEVNFELCRELLNAQKIDNFAQI